MESDQLGTQRVNKCLILLLAILPHLSCILPSDDCPCEAMEMQHKVHILDLNRRPVDSLVTQTLMKHSGLVLQTDSLFTSNGFSPPGDYVVLTDAAISYFRGFYEPVIFRASNSKHQVIEEFVFYVDDCRCHVWKFSGPDTIIIR
jgi:hypothetical protein